MWFLNISLKLLILILMTFIKTEADSSACELKEKNLAVLDLAKESISKAKDLQPACFNDSKDISSNSSECGAKEKVSAYLDIAKNLIDDARKNYSTCDEARNRTKVVFLHKMPIDCSEILANGETKSGEYVIWPRNRILDGKQIKVYCDMDTDGGGWTVIQRRGDFSKKIDFDRNWNDYKHGFGNISEEFWIGNDNIFALTNQRNYIARFDMVSINKEYRFAKYSSFWIEDEKAGYRLHFNQYNGTAGDGMESMNNMQFIAKDKQFAESRKDCPILKKSGFWFFNYHCGGSNPNGINRPGAKPGKEEYIYMNWKPWTVYDSLLAIEIKIKSEN